MFNNLSLSAQKAFYEKDLAAKGFEVKEEEIGKFTPTQLKLISATGRLDGGRAEDGAQITASFASQHGVLRQSRLYTIVWRITSN